MKYITRVEDGVEKKYVSLDEIVNYFDSCCFDHGCDICPSRDDRVCIDQGDIGYCHKKIAKAIIDL